MKQYTDLLRKIMDEGDDKDDRTGVGTRAIFGHQMRFDLSEGFPILTTKKINFKAVAGELLWFLKGDTNVEWLHEHGIKIWDEWADENGNLGPIYGAQWRMWPDGNEGEIDQIADLIDSLHRNPSSRRHVVSAWNPAQIDEMALPPCHCLFQFHRAGDRLSCQMYQRSGDMFLGVPFNISSYALLTHLVARETGCKVGEFIHVLGDAHIYKNHFEQVREQLAREPKKLPELRIVSKEKSMFDLDIEDIELVHYDPHPAIKAPIAV